MTSAGPKAIIVPHAAYLYSGQVAATALAALAPSVKTIERIVLIGPAHYPYRLTGSQLLPWRPLKHAGLVLLDRDALAAVAQLPPVKSTDAPHFPEHALEVELPFLQVLLGRFAAVPLLVGGR